ncbi:DUF4872 domain-containing protein [Zhihengliuella flava]|uniref:DUF4872 domain-containing protein n=1 Tax=Zhihengliuella flava TaxID=1285193 RepID=A0A931GJL7_9MICC|nr:DUF4872 domain-containing protein [Zhihengliuella flava]MBG6085476.1 hypothetical protein [Zhihengliuella flava]
MSTPAPKLSAKQVQKLARARMGRTGETYTQARKAVLAGQAEPSAAPVEAEHDDAAQLPEYPAPESVVQYDAALWQRVLTQAGVLDPATGQPFTQAMLAGLAGGIGFMVFTFDYESGATATVVTRAHPEPYVETLIERLPVPVRQAHTTSAKAAAARLDEGLEAGRAVVVRVTETLLPWVKSTAPDTEAESVDLAVLGEEEKFLIDDGSGALRELRRGQLAAARGRRKKDRHWQAWVPEALTPEPGAVNAAIAEAVRATSGRLLGTSELTGIPDHFAKNFGVAGLRTWAERLVGTGKRDWPALFADPEAYASALNMVNGFFAAGRHSGQGGFRGLYADFLAEAAPREGLAPLADAVDAYRDLADQWEGLIALLAAEYDDAASHRAQLAESVSALADAEQAAAEILAGAADRLEP